MKMFRNNIVVATVLVAVTSLLLSGEKVRGQTPNVIGTPFISIGSTNAVMSAETSIVTFYALYIQQTRNGSTRVYSIFQTNRTFASKQELDDFNSMIIPLWAPTLFLYTGTNIDYTLPFSAYGHADCRGYDLLYRNYQFTLVPTGTGQYELPVFPASVPMSLYPYWSAFYIPGVKSVIMEVLKPEGWVVETDSRLTGSRPWILNDDGTGGGVDVDKEFLILPPGYITGAYRLRLSIVYGSDNSFVLVNENGFSIPETPTILTEPIVSDGKVTVTGHGGDPGRYLVMQSSSDQHTWTNASEEHVVGAIGNDSGLYLTEPIGSRNYYRIKAINKSF